MTATPSPSGRRKAVVLGASGFIGINLAQALDRAGHAVTLFARHASPAWPASATALTGDVAAPPAALIEAMEDAAVYHLVSASHPTGSTAGTEAEFERTVAPTLRLLEASRGIACRWVLASSGGTVYGPPRTDRVAEDHPTEPISSYGVCKLAIEKYFSLYRHVHGLDFVIARIANPYGPWQDGTRGQGLVAAMLHRMTRGETIEIWGDGENVRDYLFVGDVAEALMALSARGQPGRIYNVGSGEGTSINTLVARVAGLVGVEPKVVYRPARATDVRRNVLEVQRIRTEIGWTAKTPLDAGTLTTFRWYAGQGR